MASSSAGSPRVALGRTWGEQSFEGALAALDEAREGLAALKAGKTPSEDGRRNVERFIVELSMLFQMDRIKFVMATKDRYSKHVAAWLRALPDSHATAVATAAQFPGRLYAHVAEQEAAAGLFTMAPWSRIATHPPYYEESAELDEHSSHGFRP